MTETRKDIAMIEAEVRRAQPARTSGADEAVEAAVRRLMEAGKTRTAALATIDGNLYKALHLLNSAGIGRSSHLRQMSLSSGMKLNAELVAEQNAEDARDGI